MPIQFDRCWISRSQVISLACFCVDTETHVWPFALSEPVTYTHTHPFNGALSGTTQVSQYQKKPSPTHTRPEYDSTMTHSHPFNGPLSGTTQVSRYQKGKNNLDFTGARDSEWQWHQLGHMQVCTSLQTDNHASTPPLSFYRPDALPAAQPTVSKHWRQWVSKVVNNIEQHCRSLLYCLHFTPSLGNTKYPSGDLVEPIY